MNREEIIKNETEKIKKNPYTYINKDWINEVLPHVGERTFSITCLQPVSLILPDIPLGSKVIKTNINLLEVSTSGSGKSSKADKMEKISYAPLKIRDISAAELQMRAVNMQMLSLIIEDFSQFSTDYEKVKILEGMTGEESSIDKMNRNVELTGDVKATALLFGTPIDLERFAKQLEGGMLSRCYLNIIYLSSEEHNQVGKFIMFKAGDSQFSELMKLKEQVVVDYYDGLKKIQSGRNSEIYPIVNYNISTDFKNQAFENWSKISAKLIAELGDKSYIRDLNYYFKFLVCSAFLNVYNRKRDVIEIGKDEETNKVMYGSVLYPNEEDHKLAVKLMLKNMRTKWALDKALYYKKNIKTFDMFKKILNEESNEVKDILMYISPYAKLVKEGINI